MAVSVGQFYAEFTEYASVGYDLVAAKLADAEQLTGPDFGSERDLRVKYFAAELLALSPYGEFARLDPSKEPDGARSIYERRRLEIDRSYTPLAMVL